MARNKYPEETVKLIVDVSLKLFIEKGYDSTSIQDIINHLGGLSKGAIYHHFKSKDEIFEAVCAKMSSESDDYYRRIRDDATKSGLERLRTIIRSAYLNPIHDAWIAMMQQFLKDPKFLTNQIAQIYELVAPVYIQPIIEIGMADGSIETENPKELAEVLMTLFNIWLNPVIVKSTREEIRGKVTFLAFLLKSIGIELLDSEDVDQFVELCERYNGCSGC